MNDLKSYLSTVSDVIESWLAQNLKNSSDFSARLYESMLYSLNAGGKRLRPALFFMGYNLIKAHKINDAHPVLPFAAAAEMVHTYSLIHDDLPGMDNDNLRRGKPTNHVQYGEATAILAGDALLTKAFEIFSNPENKVNVDAESRLLAMWRFLKSVGPDGMVGGQYADIASEKGHCTGAPASTLEYIHTHKTADFIRGSVVCGAELAGMDRHHLTALRIYGDKIGLAFQITDDILDVTSSTEKLGKTAGSDAINEKLTYPAVYGLDKSKEIAGALIQEAKEALSSLDGNVQPLLMLADFINKREK